jgi:hypothetical protein
VAPQRVFVVEWLDVAPYASGSTSGVTFEVLLEEGSGAITFAYQDVTAGLSSFDRGVGATIGVEEQLGTEATQISYNQPTVSAGTAYRCASGSSSPPDTTAPTATAPSATLFAPQTLGTTSAVHLAWPPSADVSGIAGYDLQFSKSGGSWTDVVLGSPTATSVDFAVSTGKSYVFQLRARDGAGNVGPWASNTVMVNLLQEGAASVSYSGAFKSASLSGASGGKVRHAAGAGRVARLTFSGTSVGFVTTLGPARGVAEVWVDGAFVGTLDMYSPTLKTKAVAWAAATSAGAHTLEIRLTGTRNPASTSSRVDIDAFLVAQ